MTGFAPDPAVTARPSVPSAGVRDPTAGTVVARSDGRVGVGTAAWSAGGGGR